jgi:hypothetical protein
MKNRKLLTYIAFVALVFTSCKKEGDTIVNNYTTSDEEKNPVRVMLKGYGNVDSSQKLSFSYFNDQIGELSEIVSLYSGSGSKMAIQYSGNNPSVFQTYSLPANTLDAQGTYRVDAQGRIIQVIVRKINGDTTGIIALQYERGPDYQPSSYTYYDKTAKRITAYEFITYDKNGNVTRVVSYTNNGTKTYKSGESEVSGYGKGINGLTQIYNYVAASLSGSLGGGVALYLSNYMPGSIRQQSYNADGTLGDANITSLEYTVNANNHVSTLRIADSPQIIYFKY